MVSSVDVDLAFRASGSASESKPVSAFDPGVVASHGHLGVKALHVKTHRTGRYYEASTWTERAMWAQSNYFTTKPIAAASNALAGRHAEARKAIARVRELDPAMCMANIKDWIPFRRPEDLARLEDGLRKAGLPET
jgi:hypothetical protein